MIKNTESNNIYLIILFIIVMCIGICGVIFYYWFNKKEETICDYNLVCGKDNKTYTNKCRAKIAGIEIAYNGACNNNDNNCTNTGKVCGVDNITYYNSCAVPVEILHNGECVNLKIPLSLDLANNLDKFTTITQTNNCVAVEKSQQCGIDGKTYYSDNCNSIKLVGPIVPCVDDCNNFYDYNPVCGNDNKTYINKCRAKGANVNILYKGFCKENNKKDTNCVNIGTVCGVDNITYINSCDAPVEILHKGKCVKQTS